MNALIEKWNAKWLENSFSLEVCYKYSIKCSRYKILFVL